MQKPCPIVSAELSRRALSKRRLLPLEAAYDSKRKSCGKIFCLRQPPDLWEELDNQNWKRELPCYWRII
jgi:hypothetical protein